MTNEPNGPYKLIRDIGIAGPGIGPKFLGEKEVLPALNAAWLAGRASRDGLREAAKAVMAAMDARGCSNAKEFFEKANPALEALDKALSEDEKEGK